MTIQTYTSNQGWVNCEHKDWNELIKDNWKIEKLAISDTGTPFLIMTRNGYINSFREVEE